MYNTIIFIVVLSECEEITVFVVFENKVLRTISGPTKDEVSEQFCI
jgi:hypothetical protein